MVKQKWIAMLLAGGKGTRLNLLTRNIVKPAIPFGGKYRIIDFALSNCSNSRVETVGVLTQYQHHTLNSYLRNDSHRHWKEKTKGVTILPPHSRIKGKEWYEGTSHAVFQNIDFIEAYNPEHVLILSGDQIYKMDYNLMLEQHIDSNADCTISVVEVPWKDAGRFGLVKINRNSWKILDFQEKPEDPTTNLASMGIYIFKWKILKEYLIQEEQKKSTGRDFAKDIIPAMMQDGMKLYAYHFPRYWRDVGTVYSYWEANLDLLARETNIFLENPEWPVHTLEKVDSPTYIDKQAKVHHSLISDGCMISGTVENSVLFSGVKVGKDTILKNSLVLPGTVVEDNVWIENAVVGMNSWIKDGVFIVSRNPYEHLMVVGNQAVIDPDLKHVETQTDIKLVTS